MEKRMRPQRFTAETARASAGDRPVYDCSDFLAAISQDRLGSSSPQVEIAVRRDSGWSLSTSSWSWAQSRFTVDFSAGSNRFRETRSCRWSEIKLRMPSLADGGRQELLGHDGTAEDTDTDPVGRCSRNTLRLSVPLPLKEGSWGQLRHVLNAWARTAMETLSDNMKTLGTGLGGLVAGGTLTKACRLGLPAAGKGAALPMVPSNFLSGSGDLIEQGLATHVGLFSLTAAMMFIASIRGLNKHSTAREGNMLGMLATALALMSVLASPGFHGAHLRFFVAALLAGGVGYGFASQVKMEEMPQLIAGFHSFVGLAAVFTGFASYLHPQQFMALKAFETFLGTAVGMLTFTGSVVAAGKLHGTIPGRPIIMDSRWLANFLGMGLSGLLAVFFTQPQVYGTALGTACLMANTVVWGGLGVNMVLPIGGADMPVVVSLLNAFSGLATSAAGFMLSNNLLTITGALVASSGTLLSDIMCRGINRSMGSVLLGGFGTDGGGAVAAGGTAVSGNVREVSAAGFVGMLINAKRVVIVPGYGLAVARCQQRLADIVALLRRHGVVVHFAIHPVAGRLPGHMNVLLAEADVPYDIVKEMEDINPDLRQYDVAIVVGANDIVNPATQTDTSSPIYGMPAIEVWESRNCIVLKRSMATGYSGVDNPLFCHENVQMLFGDARSTIDIVFHLLEESQDRILGAGAGALAGSDSEGGGAASGRPVTQEEFPPACKVVGVIRERRPGEKRVSVTPAAVPTLRRMGFSVLVEAGAGAAAGFFDEEYVQCGGVQLADTAVDVLKQADVVLKVNEPLPDEVQMLRDSQTMVAFWNMFGTEDLTKVLRQSMASVVNLSLVPRVSRAQKLDALTSMANIAGYRATLDAFNHCPRFSRSSVTACGAIAPARVFVIGAGVAGLSAIITAHALGAKVVANDVRLAVRDQIESLGAEFIPIDAEGIVGEGVGGYAREMGADFHAAQVATYARVIKDVDIVITTAMIPNTKAPVVISAEVVESMRRGSVIVDLAAQTGGNCALTEKDETFVTQNGITIIGETNYAASMPAQASEMLANNFAALLETLGGAADFGGAHWDDPIIRPATVVHQGQVVWDQQHAAAPAESGARPPQPAEPASASAAPEAPLAPPVAPLPAEVDRVIQWMKDHQHELSLGLGAAVVLGLGFGADIPDAELTHIGYFVLSLLIGHFTVAGVTPALHTPLISVTNAISGIIVVGGMLQLSGPLLSARVACALAAVFLSSINIVGGFAVTQRMLEMFREDRK